MRHDNQIVIAGYIGTEVDYREPGGVGRAIFRLGCTPGYWDRGSGGWRDLETVWLTVKTFRQLARHAAESLHKGEPVVVTGRLRADVWADANGERQYRTVLEASHIGHDLDRGTTRFARSERPVDHPAAAVEEDRAVIAELEAREPVTDMPGG